VALRLSRSLIEKFCSVIHTPKKVWSYAWKEGAGAGVERLLLSGTVIDNGDQKRMSKEGGVPLTVINRARELFFYFVGTSVIYSR